MPVYNASRYLREAVESVLGQTFADFEFIAVDDGSTDDSLAILREYERRDGRVRVISRPNTGIVVALNEMLGVARGEFIARMDSDDVCLPERFEKQVAWLKEDPKRVAVGCWILNIDADGDPINYFKPPVRHDAIDERHVRGLGLAVAHPAAMIRHSGLRAIGGYRKEYEPAEDVDLFLRLGEVGELGVIPEVLLRYRNHAKSVSHEKKAYQMTVAWKAVEDACLRRGLSVPVRASSEPTTSDESLHSRWAWWAFLAGFGGSARKHARRAVAAAPLRWAAWKLLLVTHLKRRRPVA